MKNIIFLVAALIAACIAQTPGCQTEVTAAARTGSWKVNEGRGVIYDIFATNKGTCGSVDIGINPGIPANSEIISHWNLNATSRFWLFTNFGGVLQPGQTASAGLIVLLNTTDDTIPELVVTVYGVNCEEGCSDSVGSDSTSESSDSTSESASGSESASESASGSDSTSESSDSTSESSDSTSESSDSTSESASESESASGSSDSTSSDSTSDSDSTPIAECNITSTLTKTHEWEQDGVPYATYALTLVNEGSTSLINYNTGFGYYPGEITQTWNLEPSIGGYAVVGFGDALAPGVTYSGAGFIVSNATEVQLQIYGTNCQ